MANETSSVNGIHLREGEDLRASLQFQKLRTQEIWGPGEITLTNLRLVYVEGQGRGALSRSAALADVTNLRITGRPRDKDTLLLALLTVVLTFAIGYGMGAAFPGGYSTVTPSVLVVGLLIASAAVIWWWFNGGNAMFHVSAGDTTVYAKVSESLYRQVTEFLKVTIP